MTIEDLLEQIDAIIEEAFTNREPGRLAALQLQLELKVIQLKELLNQQPTTNR